MFGRHVLCGKPVGRSRLSVTDHDTWISGQDHWSLLSVQSLDISYAAISSRLGPAKRFLQILRSLASAYTLSDERGVSWRGLVVQRSPWELKR